MELGAYSRQKAEAAGEQDLRMLGEMTCRRPGSADRVVHRFRAAWMARKLGFISPCDQIRSFVSMFEPSRLPVTSCASVGICPNIQVFGGRLPDNSFGAVRLSGRTPRRQKLHSVGVSSRADILSSCEKPGSRSIGFALSRPPAWLRRQLSAPRDRGERARRDLHQSHPPRPRTARPPGRPSLLTSNL